VPPKRAGKCRPTANGIVARGPGRKAPWGRRCASLLNETRRRFLEAGKRRRQRLVELDWPDRQRTRGFEAFSGYRWQSRAMLRAVWRGSAIAHSRACKRAEAVPVCPLAARFMCGHCDKGEKSRANKNRRAGSHEGAEATHANTIIRLMKRWTQSYDEAVLPLARPGLTYPRPLILSQPCRHPSSIAVMVHLIPPRK
jgi:hypothetical protein